MLKQKSPIVTTSMTMPETWNDRLDAIVKEGKLQKYAVTKSSLILIGLKSIHDRLGEMEKELGLDQTELEELY